MKPIPDCVPDALKMIIATARAVSDDDFIHRKVLIKVMGEIADDGDMGANPADFYLLCWETACRALGVRDPYEKEKARGNKTAIGILKSLAQRNQPVKADLQTAVNVSFAGAMIGFSGLGRSDIEEKIEYYCQAKPGVNESKALLSAIDKADRIMLVADRAGEIAMDKPLAERLKEMGKTVYLAVSAKPVFTMATEKDAETAGFSPPIRVISPGTAMYGLVQERASNSFREIFDACDLVIAKGDVHFCSMSPHDNAFFILRAQSRRVAEMIGVARGAGAIIKKEPAAEVRWS
ncbi:MAG: ARMT1-like domain-containing protein [Planctomycetota bacterium]|jgi:uncharacterized protein with ATP-grasp and redox domains|nr:ARMT1-like domain-containing protein [Planctomycetota bacterium]